MKWRPFLTLATVVAAGFAPGAALAISPFKKAFDEKYVKASEDETFQATFRKAGCYTCHIKGKKKDVLNHYGWQLSQLIDGVAKDRIDAARKGGRDAKKAEETKLVKELEQAFKKAESIKTPDGKTYGELFKAHGLPPAAGAKSIRD